MSGQPIFINLKLPGTAPQRMALSDFLAANADGIDADEACAIRAAVAAGRAYEGGGGAAGAWRVRPVG